jgi:uncharacterized membrane protein
MGKVEVKTGKVTRFRGSPSVVLGELVCLLFWEIDLGK